MINRQVIQGPQTVNVKRLFSRAPGSAMPPAAGVPSSRVFLPLVLACIVGLACLARAEVFNGSLDVASQPTVVIPLTLAKDGSLSLEITVGPHLNLNANTAVGVSQGVIVYDSTGTNHLYGAVQGQDSTVTHVVHGLGAGSYSVRLTAIGSFPGLGWGPYTMITSETPDPLPNDPEPNDDFDHALTASLGAEVTGHLGYLGPQSVQEAQDYWQVTLPSDGTLLLDIATGERLNLNRNVALDASGGIMVYDADQATVFFSTVQGENSTRTHSVPKLKAGLYYVRLVVLGAGYYGSYRLTPSHIPEAVPNDSEPNDAPTEALSLTLETRATGHLGYYGGGGGTTTDAQDWYRLTLPQAGNLELEVGLSKLLNLNANASIGANNGIVVFDSDAATALFGAVQGENRTNTHVVTRLKPGVYYLRLAKIDNAGYYGGYTVTPRLDPAPEDPEPNDQVSDAGWTALGATIEGNLGFRGGGAGLTLDQLDWWQFTMPSTGQVQLVVTTYGNLNLNSNSAVGASEGIGIFEATSAGEVGARRYGAVQGQGTTQTHAVNLAAGRYFLRLAKHGSDSYWGTYSATFNYVGAPIINSPALAQGLAGQPFTYAITALGGGTFEAQGLPPELSLDPITGVISGTLGQPGTHEVTLLATNGSGSASTLLTLAILPLPTLSIRAAPGQQVVLSWSDDYADFTLLRSSAAGGSAVWEPVQPAPTPVGGSLVVTNAVGTAPAFYRLTLEAGL
ncbi:MAG TPA: Ig domain-containing protein [Verrucomicrobiota bacterium]|nr:Ig domain-containing protein [Verrucomicrobiota bacterium]